ncbi:MAG TPA: TadE/TadG family type IV pilus assembly protein [Micropepsaceae bacterium]|jgi:Flp pilus assembly protein TadG
MEDFCHRFRRSRCATTAIEFAIVAPFLFAIMFGIIGFGMQFATHIALTYAATEGGRAAVAGLNDGERETLARGAITKALTALKPLIKVGNATISFDMTAEATDQKINIGIAYNDTRFAVLPFVPNFNNQAPVTVTYYVTDPSG